MTEHDDWTGGPCCCGHTHQPGDEAKWTIGKLRDEVATLREANEAWRLRVAECAYCAGLPFVDYRPGGAERGLCRQHAQSLAIDYQYIVACIKRAAEPIGLAVEYAEGAG